MRFQGCQTCATSSTPLRRAAYRQRARDRRRNGNGVRSRDRRQPHLARRAGALVPKADASRCVHRSVHAVRERLAISRSSARLPVREGACRPTCASRTASRIRGERHAHAHRHRSVPRAHQCRPVEGAVEVLRSKRRSVAIRSRTSTAARKWCSAVRTSAARAFRRAHRTELRRRHRARGRSWCSRRRGNLGSVGARLRADRRDSLKFNVTGTRWAIASVAGSAQGQPSRRFTGRSHHRVGRLAGNLDRSTGRSRDRRRTSCTEYDRAAREPRRGDRRLLGRASEPPRSLPTGACGRRASARLQAVRASRAVTVRASPRT